MSEREALKEKIIEILGDIVISSDDISFNDTTDLKNDLKLDSLGFIHLIMGLNDTFDIEIGSTEITNDNFKNVAALIDFIEKKLGK